jgi:hypothetical protein
MKNFVINYILYICKIFLKSDDLNYVKNWSKPFIKVTLFIRNIYFVIFSIIFFPFFIFDMKIRKFVNKKLNILN